MKHVHGRSDRAGFTLIELLVVISILALLIGILLPSLGSMRRESRAVPCAANLHSIAQAMGAYIANSNVYPAAYVYGDSQTGGTWRVEDQQGSHPNPINGYVHWSFVLLGDGDRVPESAFTCPATPRGGAPSSNPGANPDDWDSDLGQVNDMGQSTPSEPPKNRQARRMAYTANAAVISRNKFNASATRKNQLVKDSRITNHSRTILFTEFVHAGNWSTVFSGNESKSHRPISPFIGTTRSGNIYDEPDGGATEAFEYPDESSIRTMSGIGPDMIGYGAAMLNAVGRSHPTTNKSIGGSANFAFADGHVERMTVLDSLTRRLWGDRFYSLTGSNTRVRMEP
ncbi:Type II secretion system protein G [Phycisphaerales bacterium]|nr:Type II secretion system protein G [Phycisphaerales bacterium]